jgi:hypothetical protein
MGTVIGQGTAGALKSKATVNIQGKDGVSFFGANPPTPGSGQPAKIGQAAAYAQKSGNLIWSQRRVGEADRPLSVRSEAFAARKIRCNDGEVPAWNCQSRQPSRL